MRWYNEFRAFIQRGNVIDLAVAVIIGAAFTAIVNSLVKDILMPLLGIPTRGADISKWAVRIQDVDVTYGAFIQAIINFLLVSVCVFLLVKAVNALHSQKLLAGEPKPAELTTQEKLLTEIRDLLKDKEDPSDATVKIDKVSPTETKPQAPG